MSRTRSYEFYEVRVGAAFDVLPAYHGSQQACEDWVRKHGGTVDDMGRNMYVVRVTLVYAIKADKEQREHVA